jgi:hypothetical protein
MSIPTLTHAAWNDDLQPCHMWLWVWTELLKEKKNIHVWNTILTYSYRVHDLYGTKDYHIFNVIANITYKCTQFIHRGRLLTAFDNHPVTICTRQTETVINLTQNAIKKTPKKQGLWENTKL